MSKKVSLKADLTNCLIKKRPIVIVEGKDDPKFYNKMIYEYVTENDKSINIRKVNVYENKNEEKVVSACGCKQIISLLKANEKLFIDDRYKGYLLAIIDGDLRKLEQKDIKVEEFKSKGYLLELKYYSFESHCFNKNILCKEISKYTSATKSEISDCLLDFAYEKIKQKACKELFELSILSVVKKLKGTKYVDIDYNCFKKQPKRQSVIKCINQEIKDKIYEFAKLNNLNNDFETIKKILKGKWFLIFCSAEINYVLDILKNNKICDKGFINQEIACTHEKDCNKKECVFYGSLGTLITGKEQLTDSIYTDMKNTIDESEVKYIIDAIRKLKIAK